MKILTCAIIALLFAGCGYRLVIRDVADDWRDALVAKNMEMMRQQIKIDRAYERIDSLETVIYELKEKR